MNIVIGYANSLSRDFVQSHLASSDPSICVLTCGTISECLDIIHDNLTINMVGLDVEMSGMDGLAGLERVRDACSHPVPIALIGPMVKRWVIRDMLGAKVAGYLTYSMSSAAILNAIKLIASGEIFVPTDMMDDDIYAHSQFLTRREHDVLSGLLAGRSNKEMALNLNLSEVTIKHHLKSLRSKLGARNRTHAVCRAIELGIN